jgi:hypothetical protein
MKPKSTHKQAATDNRKHKTNNRTQKRKTQNPTPKIFPIPPKYPTLFRSDWYRGRRLRLAGVSICNRTATSQPDVESLCPLWAPFRPGDDDESKNPTSVDGSRWVSKREIRLGSDIRSGRISVDAVETNIGVVRYDFGKTDLHPQVAEGDGRTLISIGG